MAEYLIREESLVEIADAVRTHWGYYDDATQMIENKNGYGFISIIIPDTATTIGECAFKDCYNFKNIIIPESITNIGNGVFMNCSYLADIYMHSTIPPTLANSSTNTIPATATIHVPIGSGDIYRNATNWSSFADKIVEDIEI